MKKNIHPQNYRPVLFFDTQANKKFLIASTIETREKMVWDEDGKEYDSVKIETSSASHPFYNRDNKLNAPAVGREAWFKKRYEKVLNPGQKASKKAIETSDGVKDKKKPSKKEAEMVGVPAGK